MNYRYNCENEIIRVWVWNDDFHTDVTVTDKTGKSYERTIREDENGRFFTWNKNKIYLKDWIRTSLKELREKVERKEWITSDDLCQAILTDGIENARFVVPFRAYSGPDYCKDTLCKIQEKWNREVKQNYKLVLVPVLPKDDIATYEDFYTSDMTSMICNGIIKIADSEKTLDEPSNLLDVER